MLFKIEENFYSSFWISSPGTYSTFFDSKKKYPSLFFVTVKAPYLSINAIKSFTRILASDWIFAFVILRYGYLEESETVINKATLIGKHALREEEFKADIEREVEVSGKKLTISLKGL